MHRLCLLVFLSVFTATASTFRTNPGPNAFGGPTVTGHFVARDPEHREQGLLEQRVFYDERRTNRRIELLHADWHLVKHGNWKTLLLYDASGRLTREEKHRTNEDIFRAGWDRKITSYNASGFTDISDYFYIAAWAARENIRMRREHFDPEGRIKAVTRFFTQDYALQTGLVREMRRFDSEGLAEILTFASNEVLRRKGVLMMTESRAPDLKKGGEVLWRESLYDGSTARKTGILRVRRHFNPLGRTVRDEISFTEAFEEKKNIIQGILLYDNFGHPVKLTGYDQRQKVKTELFGAPAVSGFLGKRFPSLP